MANLNDPKRRREHGTGFIRARGPRKWLIGGELFRTSSDAPRRQWNEMVTGTKADAREKLKDRLQEIAGGTFAESGAMTFGELANRFLLAREVEIEPTTLALYRRDLATHIRPAIGRIQLKHLSADHIRALLANARDASRTRKRGEPLGPTTKRNLLVRTRAIFEGGRGEGHLAYNVAMKVGVPKQEHVERPIVTPELVKEILAAVKGSELEAVVTLAITTGMRRSELCGLRWGDVDFRTTRYAVVRAVANVGKNVIVKPTKT